MRSPKYAQRDIKTILIILKIILILLKISPSIRTISETSFEVKLGYRKSSGTFKAQVFHGPGVDHRVCTPGVHRAVPVQGKERPTPREARSTGTPGVPHPLLVLSNSAGRSANSAWPLRLPASVDRE